MNKLLVITVLVALLAHNAESFRVSRQAEDTEVVVVVEEEVVVVPEEVVEEVVPEKVVPEEVVPEEVVEVVTEEVVPEEVVEEVVPEKGTMAKFTDSVKAYYSGAVNTASEYLEKIKGLKLEEKAKNLYTETTNVVTTYAGIMHDQIYHSMYQK
ncbi:apolipoprotein C-II [Pseudochaenichthys georgianus]|uniref:apolipoprotein C-II n=1 Tax=Pseudochaenichthys georgianus TaxID=52239 RepID=UPI0039C163DA